MHYIILATKSICVYLFIIVCIRIFGKKELAQLSIMDLVFILLIANCVQNAMVGDDTSLPGGMTAAFGLFVANYIFKYLMRRSKKLDKFIEGEKILLIHEGHVIEQGLKKAMMTREELMRAIREHGIAHLQDVSLAILECDGNISVLSDEYKQKSVKPKKKPQLSHNP
jgi:uncharacterized membrane protein YcaP (DUF421 family)